MNIEAFEAETRARLEAAQTDGDRLTIAIDLLREATAQSRRAQATTARALEMSEEAQDQAQQAVNHAVQAAALAEDAHSRAERLAGFLHGSVAAIFDDEYVLRTRDGMDPHKLLDLLLKAVDECRLWIAANEAQPRLQ